MSHSLGYSVALPVAGHEDIRGMSRGHADTSRVYSQLH